MWTQGGIEVKVLVVICLIQTLVLSALLWRTEMLDTQVEQLTDQLSIYQIGHQAGNQIKGRSKNAQISDNKLPSGVVISNGSSAQQLLTIEQSRFTIREELLSALAPTPALANSVDVQQAEQKRDTGEFNLAEIEAQIDYLLSDADFTQVDVVSVETELVALNAKDRRRILNKMTQSMTEAGVPLSR